MYIEMIHCVNVNSSVKSCSVETELTYYVDFQFAQHNLQIAQISDCAEHVIHVTKVVT